jgi:hypothetical protein
MKVNKGLNDFLLISADDFADLTQINIRYMVRKNSAILMTREKMY